MKASRLLFLLLVLCQSATAQSSVWKVTHGENTVYLGGTCHLLRKADYPLPKEFDQAYAAADKLIFEVDPAELEKPEFAMRLMAESVYRDGRSLKTVLNKEAYEALAEQGRKSNIPIEVIQNTKPGMAVMMMSIQELTKAGVTQTGVDLHYHKKAIADSKPIGSLETPEFQLKLIIGMGEGNESEFVLYGLQDLDNIGEYFDELIAAWKSGDLESTKRLFIDDMEKYPQVYEDFLKGRNEKWIPQIEKMLQDEATEYVLVGFGHMPGKDGVIELLKARGYSVSQL